MKKPRYTEEQIAYALRQAETGTPVVEMIRRMGISEHIQSLRSRSHRVGRLSGQASTAPSGYVNDVTEMRFANRSFRNCPEMRL